MPRGRRNRGIELLILPVIGEGDSIGRRQIDGGETRPLEDKCIGYVELKEF